MFGKTGPLRSWGTVYRQGLGPEQGRREGALQWGGSRASYSQPVAHKHFDEEAPGLPAQAQERGLLEGHIVVSDVHQCRPIVFPNERGDSRQAAGVERAGVRGGLGLRGDRVGCQREHRAGDGGGGRLRESGQNLACPAPSCPPDGSTALSPGQPNPALGPRSSIPVPAFPQPRPVPAVRSLCQGDMPPEPGPSLSSPSPGLAPCLNSTESALAFPSMLSVCPALMEAQGGGQSSDTQAGCPRLCF